MNYKVSESLWLVSVIIPVYNAENCLNECLDSVIKQTYSNLEIILIDDGSNDNSGAICDDYARLDKRIKVIHTNNSGVSKARNTGIEVCKGFFITFIDSDDYIDKNYILCLIEPLYKGHYDLVLCNYLDYYVDGGKIEEHLLSEEELRQLTNDVYKDFHYFKYLMPLTCCKLYRTSIIKINKIRFPENLTDWEDQIFNFNYYENANKYFYINHALYVYCHRNKNSLSNQITQKSFQNSIKMLKREKEFLKLFNVYQYENVLIDSAIFIMRKYSFLENGGYKEFKLRIKEVLCIVYEELNFVTHLSFKRRVVKACLQYSLFFPLYFYWGIRHKILSK